MNKNTKSLLKIASVLAVIFLVYQGYGYVFNASTSQVDEHGTEESEHEGEALIMNPSERQARGIITALVKEQVLSREIQVPGEVMLDLYKTSLITPRISAQVVSRHVRLGDSVTLSQPLITLSSVEMAEAQGNLIVANREWQRVSKLGKDIVSERRFIEAQVAAQQAKARVEAFGMTLEQINEMMSGNDNAPANGTFTLLSPQNGTIVGENFVVGEFVEQGKLLFTLSDETNIWVEAQLGAEQSSAIDIGTPARIYIDGNRAIEGRVIQVYHSLDETTRTRSVRIDAVNVGDQLHPGQFVNVAIQVGETKPLLSVADTSVVLMDGNSTVFKLEGDSWHATAIETGLNQGGRVEVISGLNKGDEIAVSQLFLLKSLALKSQIGDEH